MNRVPAAVLAAVLVLLGCQHATAQGGQSRQPAGEQIAPYDLRGDEALGGHTLARHVGRSDADLAERLRREPQISAASTYTDELTARRAVAAAVQQSADRIRAWSARQGSRPNLVLHYVQRAGPPLGRSLARGDTASRPCDRALVVLRWLNRERRWIVLTSYPETRR